MSHFNPVFFEKYLITSLDYIPSFKRPLIDYTILGERIRPYSADLKTKLEYFDGSKKLKMRPVLNTVLCIMC